MGKEGRPECESDPAGGSVTARLPAEQNPDVSFNDLMESFWETNSIVAQSLQLLV